MTGQHRLSRVQLVNWGTFDGARSFTVPRRGLLLTGPSGAGKSSILDAMAALLVRPAKLKFNAAAQGTETGDRERNLVTYLLGAYKRETDEATGEVGTAFLRKGPNWSGVALTFHDGRGAKTTLIRLFHLRAGSTNPADVRSMFIMAPEAVDLLSLQAYAKDGIENRRVQQAFPHWEIFGQDAYTGFSAKFRKRMGLGSEQAQLLLHKTQSAKNLTNLDSLFRDFMLDEPDTFQLSAETVEQFDELTLAHTSVVDARRQVEVLSPLRDLGEQHADAVATLAQLAEEGAHLATWLSVRARAGADASLAHERPRLAGLEAELGRAENRLTELQAARTEAQRALDGSAGAELGTLEELVESIEGQIGRAQARVDELARSASVVGVEWPADPDGVGAFEVGVQAAAERFEADQRAHHEAFYAARDRLRVAREERDAVEAELRAVRRHGSNLDPLLLEARQLVAERLQVPTSLLPFVGELLEVRAGEAGWRGAIERVLGSFARTLVVPEAHYLAASEVVDASFLGTRLVYERLGGGVVPQADAEVGEASLLAKLELADSPHTDWLADRLRRRFDYACVEHPHEFRHHDRAVTRAGQVKHSVSLHEKDDRRRVDDRSRWVLGFSTEAKEAELEAQLAAASHAVTRADQAVEEMGRGEDERKALRLALARLESIEWVELDVVGLRARLAATRDRVDRLRLEHADLPDLERALTRADEAVTQAEEARRRLASRRDSVAGEVRRLEVRVAELDEALAAAPPVPEGIAVQLADRARDLDAPAERLEVLLGQQLSARTLEVERERGVLTRRITRQMAAYHDGWPSQSADWSDEIGYLPEHLERLTVLERDGLPTFEQRFFDLLQSQARNNISQLSTKIKGARRAIRLRVDEVNRSLRLTEFTPGGHLQIEVKDRALPDVDTFLSTLNEIISGSASAVFASEGGEERATAERRFMLMKGILDRLGSSDPADRLWRERCLDTRQHVHFQARVVGEAGEQLDVFTGSGGRSGGERQKLVTFCLAAALRFQLAPSGQTEPTYALVVIDEAFDKADHTFTQAGLEVFKKFGFQLLLATPMKMLQTIDDYVGGVVMVTNDSGRRSQVQELPFEADDEAFTQDQEDIQEALL